MISTAAWRKHLLADGRVFAGGTVYADRAALRPAIE